MAKIFNYIVPVFNKEDILPLTLDGLDRCASRDSRIYVIIDGCTDNSEKIVDEFSAKTKRSVVKIHMPDVHMLRSVNEALKLIDQGFSVVMQDDIVLEDINFEKKILDLYEKMGPRLGVVSLRLAANVYFSSLLKMIKNTSFSHMIEERDLISVENDALNTPRGEYGKFYPRVAAINGPNVIPEYVLKNIGIFDYKLAPYGFDDPEYCIRAMKAGYINGLFPLKFKSDIRWGGTRRSKKFLKEVKKIHTRNRKYVANKHQEYIYFLKNNIKQFISNVPIDSLDAIKDYSRCI